MPYLSRCCDDRAAIVDATRRASVGGSPRDRSRVSEFARSMRRAAAMYTVNICHVTRHLRLPNSRGARSSRGRKTQGARGHRGARVAMHPHPGFPTFARLDDICGACADPFPTATVTVPKKAIVQEARPSASTWQRVAAVAAAAGRAVLQPRADAVAGAGGPRESSAASAASTAAQSFEEEEFDRVGSRLRICWRW